MRSVSFLLNTYLLVFSLFPMMVTTLASAATVKILHTFQGGTDGGWPWAKLLLDQRTGVLLGTTEVGGNQLCQNFFDFGCGTIFALTPSPNGWKETVLYRFQGGTDGANPRTPLLPRPDGFFYGTTTAGGGAQQGGDGTVFRIQPGTWKEEVVYSFSSFNGGLYPQGAIAFDSAGNLYGLTVNGGGGAGVAYRLTPKLLGEWTEQILYSDVGTPYAGVVLDAQGNVYGTSGSGGVYNEGSVFEISPEGSAWQFSNIYSFQLPCGMFCGGAQPSDLSATGQGDLIGFAATAGIPACNGFGCGRVFAMTHRQVWREKTLYQFQNFSDGGGPGYGAPTLDSDGNIYGTTQAGGQYGFGTVFKLSHANNGWTKTILYSFPGGAGGAEPIGGVVVDRMGNIFGATYAGGKTGGKTCKTQGCGVVFEITP